MSLLEQQMMELQSRQRKVMYLKSLVEKLPGPKNEKEEAEPEMQVSQEVKAFILAKIDSIENNTPMNLEGTEATIGQFSDDVVEFIHELYSRAQERAAASGQAGNNVFNEEEQQAPTQPSNPMERRGQRPPPRPSQAPPQKQRGQKDLLSFAQENRHMQGKRVIVSTKSGKVGGVISGVSSVGFLQVQTDTGHAVPVSVDDIRLE